MRLRLVSGSLSRLFRDLLSTSSRFLSFRVGVVEHLRLRVEARTLPNNSPFPIFDAGVGIFMIASIFLGSGATPLFAHSWPTKMASVRRSLVFSGLSFCPFSRVRCKNFVRFASWSLIASSWVSPYWMIRKSSAITSTPRNPSIISCIRRCHSSGACRGNTEWHTQPLISFLWRVKRRQ